MKSPIVRTVISTQGYARAAIVAWRFLYRGGLPKKEQIGVLYAQWMVETGGKDCWCWNLGNVKVTQAQVDAGIPWFDLPGTWEIIAGKRVVLAEGDPGRRFRAYASLEAGMSEHMAFLRNRRYASSWPFVEAGDPVGFARALKAAGYYTASAEDYAKIMRATFDPWMRSDAFDTALAEIVEDAEAETLPELHIEPDEPTTVHVLHYDVPGDEPPPEAA